jgi:ribose transport system ATP-binding protein
MQIDSSANAICVSGLRKAFGATIAVDDVSFEIAPGTVHALLGENGAGKSTIIKLLSGLLEPDRGSVRIFGKEVSLSSPRASHDNGIQTAFQEMTLIRDLSVIDNMMLPYAPMGMTGMIRRKRARDSFEAHLKSIGFSVDLDSEVGSLDLAIRQKLEIARAIYRNPRILLLDEPTSTLAGADVEWLGEIIGRMRQEGRTVVFISHRLREVRTFCDNLTILRNGRDVMTSPVRDISDADVIEKIIGRSIAQTFPPRPKSRQAFGAPVLGARGLSTGRKLQNASFDLHKGEILGIAGLQGMGQHDLFMSLFGMNEIESGTILVDGQKVTITSPLDAMRPNIAIGLVPEDRKTEGLFLKLNGRTNASLPVIERFTSGGLIGAQAEEEAVSRAFAAVEVDNRALWTRAGAFSGGNQQKIAIAKWLVAESRILLLFDPTRGIDVGTKHELYVLIRNFAAAGGAVLFHSTEISELTNLCDRVLVFYAGQIVAEVAGENLSEAAIMRPALGHEIAMRESA